LPPNVTYLLQPIDIGIIYSIKAKFRLKIAEKSYAILEIKDEPDLHDTKK